MAPYSVAHMKLSFLLTDTGYDFSGDERLGIYLTNTLEEAVKSPSPVRSVRSRRGQCSGEIKRDLPIMVVG